MDLNNADTVSLVIDLSAILVLGLVWFGVARLLQAKRKKSLAYLLFFTVFYIYVAKVLDYTLFQYQSLLLMRHFVPDLILQGQTAGQEVNLILLVTLTVADLKTSLLNVLLLIPFGLGLPLLTTLQMKKVVAIGAAFSGIIELLQLITGSLGGTTFRIADVNDVIFNTAGVAIGYVLFAAIVRFCRRVSLSGGISANPFVRHIAERPQVGKQRQPN